MMNRDNSSGCLSRGANFALGLPSSKLPTFSEGGNPAGQTLRVADKIRKLTCFAGIFYLTGFQPSRE